MPEAPPVSDDGSGPARRLSTTTGAMLVVASMVGTGVFTTTGYLVRDVGNLRAILVGWALGGAVALCGALAYGELVAALPKNGGEYQLLSRIYHPAIGFAAGVVSFVVGFAAPVAASAALFGSYLNVALGTDGIPPLASGIALIVGMSTVHSLWIGAGSGFQNAFTIAKVVLIALLIVGGLTAGEPARLNVEPTVPFGRSVLSSAFAVGLIYIAYAYTGWNAAAYVAGELRNPGKTLPRALLAGTTLVTLLYVLLNVVFLMGASTEALAAAEERVAVVATTGLFGDRAGRVIAGIIAAGLVSTVGAMIMTGPRISEAIGRDFPRLGFLSIRRAGGGPISAIGLQAALAIVMLLSASYEQLLEYIGFTLSIMAALTVLGVFFLRVQEPELPRPVRAIGHPITSIVFCLVMAWMAIHTLLREPMVSLLGAATIGAGVGLYYAVRER
ncbi:MAG: amino acid permease [Myxococcota bacterium]